MKSTRLPFFVLLLSLLSLGAHAQELRNFRGGSLRSPLVEGDSVTFSLPADYATVVTLYGSWLPNYSDRIPMRKDKGVWSVKTKLPSPEIYTYNFFVDGVAVNDPANVLVQRDGSRYLSMLLVEGERTAHYGEAQRHGTVSNIWYDSEILGISRRMCVYTPYGYEDNPKTKYPVLYLLHGGGGDEEAWTSMGRAAQILDNLIQRGEAVPMIVVMPNGNPAQSAAQTLAIPQTDVDYRDPANANAYVRSLVTEIVPFIEKRYRAIPRSSSRAIAGLSMGGGHTTSATILFPGVFDYICPLSCGIRKTDTLDSDLQGIKKAGYKLYWVGCGSDDALAYRNTKVLDEALTANGMPHVTFISEGGHTWANWRLYLRTFAPLLFR